MEELVSEHGQAVITVIVAMLFWIMALYVFNVLLDLQIDALSRLIN